MRIPRYIDAFKLRDMVIESMDDNPHSDSIVRRTHKHEHEQFLKMICRTPTADVVEVVRCKDCKHWQENPWSKGEMVCRCWADWLPTEPDDFCSYGEREGQQCH